MRVIVTRPEQEADAWVRDLVHAGFDAVARPLITILPAPDAAAVEAAWERLHTFNAVMFVSANAVEQFFRLKTASPLVDIDKFAIKIRAFATGPGTVAALRRWGVHADQIDAPAPDASQFDSEALWAIVSQCVNAGYRVLVVRGSVLRADSVSTFPQGVGRDWFAQQVCAAGGEVECVVSYQRCAPPSLAGSWVEQAATDGSIWLFSSSEAIGNLRDASPQQSWHQARAVATHARIAQAARAAGFFVVCESLPTLPAVMASIESLQ